MGWRGKRAQARRVNLVLPRRHSEILDVLYHLWLSMRFSAWSVSLVTAIAVVYEVSPPISVCQVSSKRVLWKEITLMGASDPLLAGARRRRFAGRIRRRRCR